MLPHPNALPPQRYCTQSKCRVILPEGYELKSCEKCAIIARIGMQKKQKREKADEGPSRSPAITSENGHLDEGSNANLKHEVSRMISGF
jgi:hypothetical protein